MAFALFHAWRCVSVLVAALCLMASVGCGNSAYHKAGEALAGDLNDRLAVRVHEARLAAYDASGVFADQRPMSAQLADRADAAAWDYSRRVASVQDVIRRLTTPDLEGQKVLMSLERADAAVTEAVEKAQSSERAKLWTEASTALTAAMSSADEFLAGRETPQALLAKPRED